MTSNSGEFTKERVNAIQREILEAAKVIATKHGVGIRMAGGRFSELEGVLKYEITTTAPNGDTKEMRDFKEMATVYGLKPEWLGQRVRMSLKGDMGTIIGLVPSRTKFPVLVRNSQGKRLLMQIGAIRVQFGLPRNVGDEFPTPTVVEVEKVFKAAQAQSMENFNKEQGR